MAGEFDDLILEAMKKKRQQRMPKRDDPYQSPEYQMEQLKELLRKLEQEREPPAPLGERAKQFIETQRPSENVEDRRDEPYEEPDPLASMMPDVVARRKEYFNVPPDPEFNQVLDNLLRGLAKQRADTSQMFGTEPVEQWTPLGTPREWRGM